MLKSMTMRASLKRKSIPMRLKKTRLRVVVAGAALGENK